MPKNPARLMLACLVVAVTASVALGGHEVPVYPSYYPHEIAISTAAPETAADLMRSGKLQAYIGNGSLGSEQPPAPLRAVESFGSFIVLTLNPDSSLAQDSSCGGATAIARRLSGSDRFVFHPYPVTPFHGDYLYHADRAEAAKARFDTAPAAAIGAPVKVKAVGALADLVPPDWRGGGNWDAAIEGIDAAGLIASAALPINGWLGPAWTKAGWYHAERLLGENLQDDAVRQQAAGLVGRLEGSDYRDDVERVNLERDLVTALTQGCRRMVIGYTLKQQYYSAEFTDGLENIGFDAIGGLNSAMFLRTVKLKNFPWNGWLALGLEHKPRAAWNPIAGFGDEFGRLLWSAVGDPALVPAPYDSGWMLNRISDVRSSAGR